MEVKTEKKIRIHTQVRRFLADTVTPVTLFLKARDHFSEPVLLENNDFRSKEDCYSFLGFEVLGSFQVEKGRIREAFPGEPSQLLPVADIHTVPNAMQAFLQRFDVQYDTPYKGFNGLIGYTGFDGVQYFDTLEFAPEKRKFNLPDIRYNLYRFVLAINHFRDELLVLENLPEGQTSRMDEVERLIRSQKFSTHEFRMRGSEASNLTDAQFMELVTIGKRHCQLGDVFQIVFSRQFSQGFTGDDFTVYRALRSINPSPYLFYADYGSYRIFGSSPETQMAVRDGVATVNPIAGTYRRTGDDIEDAQKALELSEDPKENAEHIMLVDLARNDLGRHAVNVQVKKLKDIQFFSHVIHLVSKVVGELEPSTNPMQVFGDTFPAGTLSGAPKYKAIELINQYENQNRSFYGGALGYINFDGEMNKAIVIRSFLSQDNTLYYQAGAGIVAASVEAKELQEVNNKLGALKKALVEAEKLH
ncbi:MAG: anthranilate synthase component I family protein [Lewinellaceae bacterium]|nr:anthranilate synthase component I family protein [Phaeodactylibacter sp.]MCB0612299.1 anthranilate synthase component I family protein [Phaeodactylibacter sp.]MCB9349223.1 anthranilate synthase component I family protein [Lewinellaceae bacterium]